MSPVIVCNVCPSAQANVMLEYDIDGAQSLLEKNLATASRNLDSLEEDLNFLRDQFTTTEVSILPPEQWVQIRQGTICELDWFVVISLSREAGGILCPVCCLFFMLLGRTVMLCLNIARSLVMRLPS